MCFANSINIVWTLFYDSSTPGTHDLTVVSVVVVGKVFKVNFSFM